MSSFILDGLRNPVRAARFAIEAMGVTTDAESFTRVAEAIGDKEAIDGFVVSYDTLERLCQVGGFCIAMVDGTVKAMLPSEIPEGWR